MKIELNNEGQLNAEALAFIKAVAVAYSYDWSSSPATSRNAYFDAWIAVEGKRLMQELMRIRGEVPETHDITPEALKAQGFEEQDVSTYTKNGFEVWLIGRILNNKHLGCQLYRREPNLIKAAYTMPELLKLMEVHAVKERTNEMQERGKELEDHTAALYLSNPEDWEKKISEPTPEGNLIKVYRGPGGMITDEPPKNYFYCFHNEANPMEICVNQCEQCKKYAENKQKDTEKVTKRIEK